MRRLSGRVEVRSQPLASAEQFAFVDDVVAVEHRPRFMPRQQHGYSFWNARAHQVARGGAPTVVQQAVGHPSALTGITQRVAPDANSDAVPTKYASVVR